MVVKIGSSFVRLAYIRTHNNAHYNSEYFDTSRAVVIPLRITNDEAGSAAEGFAIQCAKDLGIGVNDRQEKVGSFGRHTKRGDVGWTEKDPGLLYVNTLPFSRGLPQHPCVLLPPQRQLLRR